MTKIFWDSEFTGLYQDTKLISIGLVTENDEIFYAEFNDYDKNICDDWVINNVIGNLRFNKKEKVIPNTDINTSKNFSMKGGTFDIQKKLREWFDRFEEIEMWSDCLAYDWVTFCEIFGGAMSIPQQINYIPFDICTLFKIKKLDPDANREDFIKNSPLINKFDNKSKHNSLWDALVIKECYNKLINF